MRFSTAWAQTAALNVTLKIATIILAFVTLAQLILIGSLAARDPVVVERGCFSKYIRPQVTDPTKDEIKSFLLEAIPMRFDSNAYVKDGFLSIEETGTREKEQGTLKQRQISQRVVISDVAFNGKDILVSTDRLVSIGKIKSALSLNMKVTVETTNRTESNPYGLVLKTVSQIEDKETR